MIFSLSIVLSLIPVMIYPDESNSLTAVVFFGLFSDEVCWNWAAKDPVGLVSSRVQLLPLLFVMVSPFYIKFPPTFL